MTFYVFIALALGAISAATETPVARPTVAGVVRACAIRAERRAVAPVPATQRRSAGRPLATLFAPLPLPGLDAPLTGAATPRAPGRCC